MSNKKRPKKNRDQMAAAKHIIKGLSISWTDDEPEKDTRYSDENTNIDNWVFGHDNPVHRLSAAHVARKYIKWINGAVKVLWRAQVVSVFEYEGVNQEKESVLESFCVMSQLNKAIMVEVAKNKMYGGKLKHVRFTMKCIGLDEPKTNIDDELRALM